MKPQSSTDTALTKKPRIPKIFLITIALFVLVLILGGYLLVTKQLVFAFGSSTEKPVTVVASVCTKDTIKQFNDVYAAQSAEARSAALTGAFEAVNKTSGYSSDPNCGYIRYAYYIEQKDTTNAQKEVDALKKLADKNLYATSQLFGVQSIESMQSDIDVLTQPNTQVQSSETGSGGRG